MRRRLGWNGLGPALPRDVKRHRRAALSCLAAWAPQARRRRCFLAPPEPASQWCAPVAGFGFRTERRVFAAAGCGPARPWLRRRPLKQPWRDGGAQGYPSAVLGVVPGRATQGESGRDQGYVAQGSPEPRGKEAVSFGVQPRRPQSRRQPSPAPGPVARFMGARGGSSSGGRGPGLQDREESTCSAGLGKGVVNGSSLPGEISLSVIF